LLDHIKISHAEQKEFASLSGDYNPIHMDQIIARRLMYGQCIVHGINLVLKSLDKWLSNKQELVRLSSLKVKFIEHTNIGEELCYVCKETLSGVRIELYNESIKKVKIDFVYIEGVTASPQEKCKDSLPPKLNPKVMLVDEMKGFSGDVKMYFPELKISNYYPYLFDYLSHQQISVLLATTRLVGMECPGMHSIYSELSLNYDDNCNYSMLNYHVDEFDERFNMTSIGFVGPQINGVITSFLRQGKNEQKKYTDIVPDIVEDEFAGQRALIIGGSRGLGETVAKTLSAGGASVYITYHNGRDDAKRVVSEIIEYGGNAESYKFDVLSGDASKLIDNIKGTPPTHLYYFATPFISQDRTKNFSVDAFNKFCLYYVVGFVKLFDLLLDIGVKHYYYPSTVYVDELPKGLGEYSSAKSAGEVMCKYLEKNNKAANVYRPKLPMMKTDQTVGLLKHAGIESSPIMLESIRKFGQYMKSNK